jgi:hypothetical protein
MNLSALFLITIISAAAAPGRSIIGRDESDADFVDISGRNLHDCVARSSYLGCFKNRNKDRALPYEIDGFYHTAEDCESECTSKGYVHFALEYKGQCFCSNGSDYDKHGGADGCDCCGSNVGENKMCVWMAGPAAPGCDGSGAPSAPYLGCYRDKNLNRALPYEMHGKGHSAKECQDECAHLGMVYFSREWRGQCFCSDHSDYDKHGAASGCDCCGSNVGLKMMCVWAVAE